MKAWCDVALWLTPFSWWPDDGPLCKRRLSLAVVQLMRTYDLQSVSKAAVTAPDGTRYRWWDMESSGCDGVQESV